MNVFTQHVKMDCLTQYCYAWSIMLLA